jgi:hypothetical protein
MPKCNECEQTSYFNVNVTGTETRWYNPDGHLLACLDTDVYLLDSEATCNECGSEDVSGDF